MEHCYIAMPINAAIAKAQFDRPQYFCCHSFYFPFLLLCFWPPSVLRSETQINDGSYNGVRKCGFSVKDASGNVIANVHGVSNHDGVQVDFLAHQIDRLASLNFIAVKIA